ncbi:MAG: hypothetical protein ABI234_17110 [Ktedonobacteraceae bacterium]
MEKHDHFFTPEHIDEQIEQRISDWQVTPETRFLSEMQRVAQQIRAEHGPSLERVEARLKQRSLTHVEHCPADLQEQQQAPFLLQQMPQGRLNRMEKRKSSNFNMEKFGRRASLLVAVLVMVVLVGGLVRILNVTHPSTSTIGASIPTSTATPASTTALSSEPPTSVMVKVSALGIPPTTQSAITIPSGTRVTLTIVPNHPLLPFQTFTMGIYATDPYGFSELQYCQYPKTATCSYVVAYSSSENTDYTKGTHTFRAFLGNIGGAILTNSSSITITWSR